MISLPEKVSTRVERRVLGRTTSSEYANTVGWFSNKHNPAGGWILSELCEYETKWLNDNHETSAKYVYLRTHTMTGGIIYNTNIARFNLSTGTYAFMDSIHMANTDEIKFESARKFKTLLIDNPKTI